MTSEKEDIKNMLSFKVVLMGESGVGKTSIVNRYIHGTFTTNMLSTTGIGFTSKILDTPDLKGKFKLDVKKN